MDGFSIFDDTLQVTPGSAARFDRDDLARWIARRAMNVGAEMAVDDCCQYLNDAEFTAYHITLLIGLSAYQKFDLGLDAWIGPSGAVPIQWVKDALISALDVRAPIVQASSAIVRSIRLPRRHVRSDELKLGDGLRLVDIVDRIRLCFNLAGSFNAQILATTVMAADNVPSPGAAGWTLHPFRYRGWDPPISSEHVLTVRACFEKLENLPDNQKERILIQLRKLNDFESSSDDVQRAIELRVALESLFLGMRNEGELSYRLAMRGAFAIGTGYAERKRIFVTLRDAYAAGSEAVHNGRFSKKTLSRNVGEILREAAEIVRRAITKRLDQPEPDYEELILGGGDALESGDDSKSPDDTGA